MLRRTDTQESVFGEFLYDQVLPKDHFLRKLRAAADFEFVNEACKDSYSRDSGRPAWEPALIFRIFLIQYFDDISDRSVEEQITFNLAFKWFVRLPADAKSPDATTLSVFRDRLGEKKFKELSNETVKIARSKNVISDKPHIIDSSDIKANVDLYRLKIR